MSEVEDTSKDVVLKEDNLPAGMLGELFEQSGQGFEGTDANDYAIPYLSIAQAGSPQLKKQDGKYIPGLEMGMFFDTVEGSVWENVNIVPVYRERFYVEWVPKDDGGGFVDRHPLSSNIIAQTTRNEMLRDILPSGNEIIDTAYLYAIVVGDDGINRPVVISFARTSMKKYKNLMSRARNLRLEGPKGKFNPPIFSHIYTMKTIIETSKRTGDDYFNWEVDGAPALIQDAATFAEAKSLRDAVATGGRGAAEPENDADGPAAGAKMPGEDDDTPF